MSTYIIKIGLDYPDSPLMYKQTLKGKGGLILLLCIRIIFLCLLIFLGLFFSVTYKCMYINRSTLVCLTLKHIIKNTLQNLKKRVLMFKSPILKLSKYYNISTQKKSKGTTELLSISTLRTPDGFRNPFVLDPHVINSVDRGPRGT